ncbi:MAG: hypothetical protein LQ340_001985 [Diploschistes diacapsis]|nr:MAG: hypothetical protein LQ340_001985 [Diploschistes diacapsis]
MGGKSAPALATGNAMTLEPGEQSLSLELGGKNPIVVFDDADLDKAVRAAFEGGFSNKGGTYTASSPIYVQQGAYPSFVEALAAGIGKLQFGNGLKRGTHVGSCVSQAQQKRLQGYIGIAGGGGGEEVAFEVKLPEDPECKDGLFVAPVVFKNVKPSMTIAQEEILGPVVTVGSFEDEDEAVRVANDSEYGIVASVFTKDVERVCRRRQAEVRFRSGELLGLV